MIKKKIFKKKRSKNLKQTLKQVDYIVLTPGINLLKNKTLKKYEKKNNHRHRSVLSL